MQLSPVKKTPPGGDPGGVGVTSAANTGFGKTNRYHESAALKIRVLWPIFYLAAAGAPGRAAGGPTGGDDVGSGRRRGT